MCTQLPQAFLSRMEEMLKDEFRDFLESYQAPRQYGLRINTKKSVLRSLWKSLLFSLPLFPGWKMDFSTAVRTDHPGILIIRPDSIIFRSPVL